MKKESTSRQPLWLAVRLPHLALEALGFIHTHTDKLIVSHKGIVWAATYHAQEDGIKIGSPTSTAQLLCPARVFNANIQAQEALLHNISNQLYQCSPYIEPHPVTDNKGITEYSLCLEVSRCLKLFRGLTPLVEHIQHLLDQLQLTYHLGLAHTPEAARLLSYTQEEKQLFIPSDISSNCFLAALKPLPLNLLKQFHTQVSALLKMGFRHFDDLIKQMASSSLSSFRRRIGHEFCEYLQDLLDLDNKGQQPSLFSRPTAIFTPEDFFKEDIQFDFPVANSELLRTPMQQLLEKLSHYLAERQLQTQQIQWRLLDIYHSEHRLVVHFDRMHSRWELPLELSLIQLDSEALPFEVDTLELRCHHATAVELNKITLPFAQQGQTDIQPELALSRARLTARMGEQTLYTLSLADSHIPEQAQAQQPAHANTSKQQVADLSDEAKLARAKRPSWLFPMPSPIKRDPQQQLNWMGPLELLQGPERIEGNWWETPTARDYFIARRDDNTRLWIFRDLYQRQWFVHGVFS